MLCPTASIPSYPNKILSLPIALCPLHFIPIKSLSTSKLLTKPIEFNRLFFCLYYIYLEIHLIFFIPFLYLLNSKDKGTLLCLIASIPSCPNKILSSPIALCPLHFIPIKSLSTSKLLTKPIKFNKLLFLIALYIFGNLFDFFIPFYTFLYIPPLKSKRSYCVRPLPFPLVQTKYCPRRWFYVHCTLFPWYLFQPVL